MTEKLTLTQRCKASEDCLPAAAYREHLTALHGDLLALLGSSQSAAKEVLDWMQANKARLHTPNCSVHEPSARCSCGLHKALSLTRAIENGTAPLFIEPRDPQSGLSDLSGNAGVPPTDQTQQEKTHG